LQLFFVSFLPTSGRLFALLQTKFHSRALANHSWAKIIIMIIQLTPHRGFSVTDYINFYAYLYNYYLY
jgi:hypothetical protein